MEKSYKDPLNPKFDLNTKEGVRSFLEWLNDPDVDKAIEKFIEELMNKITQERIAELDKLDRIRTYDLLYRAMSVGLIPFQPNLRLKRMVRVKKSGN